MNRDDLMEKRGSPQGWKNEKKAPKLGKAAAGLGLKNTFLLGLGAKKRESLPYMAVEGDDGQGKKKMSYFVRVPLRHISMARDRVIRMGRKGSRALQKGGGKKNFTKNDYLRSFPLP